jgi:hypothetical protein
MVNATLRPIYPQERDPVLIIQEAWWAPGLVWTGAENLTPTRIFSFAYPGFFPFDPFLYCLNPFVIHVTLRSMLPSLYNKHNTNIHAPYGIRTHDPSKRAAEDPRLRPHGHWIGIPDSIPGSSSP